MAESDNSGGEENAISPFSHSVTVLTQTHPIAVKLTESNYLVWRQQLMSTIRAFDLEPFLFEDQVVPQRMIAVEGTSKMKLNPEYPPWKKQDQLLASWLQSSLSENILALMVGLTISSQIWQALETSFASQSKEKAMQYKMQLQSIKKDSLPIIEYLGKIKHCCDLLAAIGCKISEDDQILYALNGLGPQYDPVMVAISARVDGWTMQEVSSLLMSFETRLEGSKSSSSHINVDGSVPSLNLTQMPAFRREVSPAPSSNTGGNMYPSNRSFGGGRGRGGRSGGRGRNGNRLVCQLCQKPGHTADRCWHIQTFASQHNAQRSHQQHQPPFQQQFGNSHPAAHIAQIRGTSAYGSPSDFNTNTHSDASSSISWYPDSGATHHVSNDLNNLNSASEYNRGNSLHLGDDFGIDIEHIGDAILTPASSTHLSSHSPRFFHLSNLLHVPKVSKNLLSVSHFAKDNGVFFEFHPSFCLVRDQDTKEVLLQGTLDNGLYKFLFNKAPISPAFSPSIKTKSASASACSPAVFQISCKHSDSLDLWHQRLGHCALPIVKRTLLDCNIPFASMNSDFVCHSCCISKSHRLPYSPSSSHHNAPLELIRSDTMKVLEQKR